MRTHALFHVHLQRAPDPAISPLSVDIYDTLAGIRQLLKSVLK